MARPARRARGAPRRRAARRGRARGGPRSGQSRSALRSRLRADRRGRAGDRGDACCGAASRSSATAKRSCASWCRRSRARSRTPTRSRSSSEHAALRDAQLPVRVPLRVQRGDDGPARHHARGARARSQPDSPETEAMRDTIAAIVERADRVAGVTPLDARDLRGWHYVLTGGAARASVAVRLRRADARPLRVARRIRCRGSRPGSSASSPLVRAASRCRASTRRRAATTRSSRARVATRLELPLAPWPAIGVPAPGLVVALRPAPISPPPMSRGSQQRRPDQIAVRAREPVDAGQPDRARRDDAALPDARPAVGRDHGRRSRDQRGHARRRRIDASVEEIAAELAREPGLDADERDRRRSPRAGTRSSRAPWPPAIRAARSRLWAGWPGAVESIPDVDRATLRAREEDPRRRG